MMSTSEYKNVIKGKLRLKGDDIGLKSIDNPIKKKKRKEKKKNIELPTEREIFLPDDLRTESEKKFEMFQLEIEKERAAKKTIPHRQKIENLNRKLDSLPTHFDIPKVIIYF